MAMPAVVAARPAAKHKHLGPRVLFTSSREKKIDRYTDFTLGNGEQRGVFMACV